MLTSRKIHTTNRCRDTQYYKTQYYNSIILFTMPNTERGHFQFYSTCNVYNLARKIPNNIYENKLSRCGRMPDHNFYINLDVIKIHQERHMKTYIIADQ